jgi:hypothetical protein
MNTTLFVALATPAGPGGYHATFPDAPGIEIEAADLARLLLDARQALTAYLQRATDAGEAWPAATPIEALRLDPGTIPLLIDIAVDDPPIRVNISLGEQLVKRMDAAAEARGMTRSGFIAQAVRVSLGERGPNPNFDAAARRLQDELRSLGRKINDSIGPESSFGQRMAGLDDQVYESVRKAADSVSAAMVRRREAGRPAEPPSAADMEH